MITNICILYRDILDRLDVFLVTFLFLDAFERLAVTMVDFPLLLDLVTFFTITIICIVFSAVAEVNCSIHIVRRAYSVLVQK